MPRKCAPLTFGWRLWSQESSPLQSLQRRIRFERTVPIRTPSGCGLSSRPRAAKPTPPSVVAEAIREIVDGDSWQLRYPVGPDALPLLKGRTSKTDEQIIDEASQSDEAFVARVKRDYGLDVVL